MTLRPFSYVLPTPRREKRDDIGLSHNNSDEMGLLSRGRERAVFPALLRARDAAVGHVVVVTFCASSRRRP